MLGIIIENLSKPLAGLALLMAILGGGRSDVVSPQITDLKLVVSRDSVYLHAGVENALTEDLEELILNGTKVVLNSEFRCGDFSKTWNYSVQHNPIKQRTYVVFLNETLDTIACSFNLREYFQSINLYLAQRDDLIALRAREAIFEISAVSNIEAFSLGYRQIWAGNAKASFEMPELALSLDANRY